MPQLSDTRGIGSRPISWHPNMLNEMSQWQMMNQGINDSLMTTPYTTAEVNGLVTPMSYPLVDEPQIQELITPLEGLSANEAGSGYGYGQDFDMTQYWLSQQTKDSAIDFDPSLYSMVNYQPQWYPADQYMMPNVPTAPTSPSFLPLPEFGAPLEVRMPEPDEHTEELVGMGLYDSPADVQSLSLFAGPSPLGQRKSLKLEDSFEPSPNEEEEEYDDEDAAVSGEEDDGQPGVSPTNIDFTQQRTADATSAVEYNQVLDNSYTMNQWQMPSQNTCGWI